MTTPDSLSCDAIYALRTSTAGDVFVPGEHGYDHARQTWNLFADQRPVAVVFAESPEPCRFSSDLANDWSLTWDSSMFLSDLASDPSHRSGQFLSGAHETS
jgi:hypothetical protein